MTPDDEPIDDAPKRHGITRRELFGVAGGVAIGAGAMAGGLLGSETSTDSLTATGFRNDTEPFYGAGAQGGIATTPQSDSYFGAFDLTTDKRSDVIALLRSWTGAAARLTRGQPAAAVPTSDSVADVDSLDAIDLGPARLTINVGFGPSFFELDGTDRFGVKAKRPSALVELPVFPNDQLIAQKVGGDLTVHACADDPEVAFHAVRELSKLASGVASLRWAQAGFNETPATSGTPRNLMGFKDGTINPTGSQMSEFVWVGGEGPSWMRAGSYVVFRRIRISLEHWDDKSRKVQEEVIGRDKVTGAPLGATSEFDPLDLQKKNADGNLAIPIDSHVRLSSQTENAGQMILRRSYAYNDGMSSFAERWPPWQQAMLFDAGLLFVCYQRDPRKGFIPIFQNLAENDSLGQFTTHTGSTIAALPPAARGAGHYIGEGLFA